MYVNNWFWIILSNVSAFLSHLRVSQKALQLPFFFFFSFSSVFSSITYPSSYMTLWCCVFARSRDKLKPSFLHYHNAYGHQIWQDGDLPWGAPIHKVNDHLIMWFFKITWQIKNISPLPQSYDHHTWRDSEIQWGTPTHKVTWPFDYVIL